MNSIEKLDAVLKCLADKNSPPFITSFDVERLLLNKNIKIEFKEITLILAKLFKDGYAYREKENDKNIYMLSYEGKYFIESGGYLNKRKREIISRRLQSWQTWAIAVGTLLAGIVGLQILYNWLTKICLH